MIATRLGSTVWTLINRGVRYGIGQGWIKPTSLQVNWKVVSVGNIQAGGAGKTPLVALIAKQALERGKTVCILCRGYRSEWENRGGLITPATNNPDPNLCGDEPALLHALVPDAWLAVGSNRLEQYDLAIQEHRKPFDLVLLDDGFQNYQIKRDLDIVAVTSATPSSLLFREGFRALDRASLIVWTKGQDKPPIGNREYVKIRYRLESPKNPSAAYWLVSGVADGSSVLELAQASGYRIDKNTFFPDHAHYSQGMIQEMLAQAQKRNLRVVLTGKDWIKWKSLGISHNAVDVIEPQIEFEEGLQLWNHQLWEK